MIDKGYLMIDNYQQDIETEIKIKNELIKIINSNHTNITLYLNDNTKQTWNNTNFFYRYAIHYSTTRINNDDISFGWHIWITDKSDIVLIESNNNVGKLYPIYDESIINNIITTINDAIKLASQHALDHTANFLLSEFHNITDDFNQS